MTNLKLPLLYCTGFAALSSTPPSLATMPPAQAILSPAVRAVMRDGIGAEAHGEPDGRDVCGVCFEIVVEAKSDACLHRFHKKCVGRWLALGKDTCPGTPVSAAR